MVSADIGSTMTDATPARFMSSSSAARGERSKIRVGRTTVVMSDPGRERVPIPRRRGVMRRVSRKVSAVRAPARSRLSFDGLRFALLGFGAMRLAGMVARELFRGFCHRTGGDHQKRERNTDRSAHVHPA